MKERNIHKGSLKLVLNSKSGLNSRAPTSALRLRYGSPIIERGSFVRFTCKVSFWILYIWVCLIIYTTLCWFLRQFRFSLRAFKMSSRFFQPFLALCYALIVSIALSWFASCFVWFSGFRFSQRNKYTHVRHCDYNFNHNVQFHIILLCK